MNARWHQFTRSFGGQEAALLLIVVVEWCLFASLGTRFSTVDNLKDIVRHSVEISLLALVMTPVVLAGGIDLSVGSLLGFCAILFGKLWRDGGMPIGIAACLVILAGTLAGGLNALLITRLRLPPLIVTLGTYSLFRGLAEAVTRGVDTFTGFPSGFLFFGQEEWWGIPAQAPILGVAALGIWIWIHRTTAGRVLRAIGYSPEGARYAALDVHRHIFQVYGLAGGVSALAALIYTARLGQAKADAGAGYELTAITAVVLGGTSIFGGKGSVHGTLLGVAALAILNNGLVHVRQPREIAGMLTGVLLLVALVVGKLDFLVDSRRRDRHSPPP